MTLSHFLFFEFIYHFFDMGQSSLDLIINLVNFFLKNQYVSIASYLFTHSEIFHCFLLTKLHLWNLRVEDNRLYLLSSFSIPSHEGSLQTFYVFTNEFGFDFFFLDWIKNVLLGWLYQVILRWGIFVQRRIQFVSVFYLSSWTLGFPLDGRVTRILPFQFQRLTILSQKTTFHQWFSCSFNLSLFPKTAKRFDFLNIFILSGIFTLS